MQKNTNIATLHPLLGAHIAGAGSLHEALLVGDKLGCTTIQIFTKNNRQWAFDLIAQDEVDLFLKTQKTTAIEIVVSHAGYLINLCSPKKEIYEKSLKGLKAELERCQQLHIPYLVLHPGARLDSAPEKALMQLSHAIETVLEESKNTPMILLENMAGQGSTMGASFEQLATIRENIGQKKRIGFCLDTCHALAAGFDLRTQETYNAFMDHLENTIGLEHLKCFHLNDSMKEFDSHVDRHEWIGKGFLGLNPFLFIMNDERFQKIPKIIETPFETFKDHAHNLAVLRKLIKPRLQLRKGL